MSKKIIIIYTLVLLVVGLGAAAYIDLNLAKQVPVSASNVKENIINPNIISEKEANLSFEVSGKIIDISKKVGDKVEEGEILARIDNASALTQYANAEAGVAIAQADLEALEKTLSMEKLKLKDLHSNDKKIQNAQISLIKRNIDSQRARVLQANDALKNEKIQLDKFMLKAPFSGIIIRQDIALGEVVNPNVSIITLRQNNN